MAKIGVQDFSDVGERRDFEAIPPGSYQVAITDSKFVDNKPTAKDPNGKQLVLELTVTAGQFEGRKIWDRLNLINSSADALRMARETLKQICNAQGKATMGDDSEELHGVVMMADVKVKPASGQYSASNEITKYYPFGAASASTPAPAAGTAQYYKPANTQAPAGVQSAAGQKPAWKR